jgi:oxygen-independent coproporphyrinogen-3 oxidase
MAGIERGIYVHIPYCLAKCEYCNFNSYRSPAGVPDCYVEALRLDIEAEAAGWRDRTDPGGRVEFGTVYFGGGTPSLLSAGQLGTIMNSLHGAFSIRSDAEVTLECNPATVGRAGLDCYRRLGVTRLSVGVQSLVEAELKFLGRLHGPVDAVEALRAAGRAGFAGISADVMLGIPGQTASTVRKTIDGLPDSVTHVSAYMLSVESGTPLAAKARCGLVAVPGDDDVAALYEYAADLLAGRGFGQYEISNWCLAGHRCRHNDVYWAGGEYAGVGAGAHSHRAGRRYAKMVRPGAYAASLGVGGNAVEFSEALTRAQQITEQVMLGLRTDRGIDPRWLEGRCGASAGILRGLLGGLIAQGLLVTKGNNLALSARGFLVHEAVCGDILAALPGLPA